MSTTTGIDHHTEVREFCERIGFWQGVAKQIDVLEGPITSYLKAGCYPALSAHRCLPDVRFVGRHNRKGCQ